MFIEFANTLLPIRLSSFRVLSSPSFSLSCTRMVFCSSVRPLGSLGFNSQSRRLFHRLASSIPPVSVVASRVQLYIHHPRVSSSFRASAKKTQESGEDEASSAIFPKRSTNCLNRKSATDLVVRVSCGNGKLINYLEWFDR
jgi:hypothetical protein